MTRPEPLEQQAEVAASSRRRSHVQRLASLGDQVLSGASNFLTVALIARSTSPDTFGQFALAYAVLLTLLSLIRGLWAIPISLAGSPAQSLAKAQRLLSAALVSSPVMVLAVAAPTLVLTRGDDWLVIAIVAAAAPVVCSQDLCRFAAVSADRPGVAVTSDAIWLVAVSFGYLFHPAAYSALSIWLAGAALALMVASVSLGLLPRLRPGVEALRSWDSTGVGVAVVNVTFQVGSYVILALATVVVGTNAAAALRGASSVMAPVNTIVGFMSLSLLPILHRQSKHRQVGMVARIAALTFALTATWCAVLLLLPPSIGRLLLGPTWPLARDILPWTSLEYVLLVIGSAAMLGLQARQAGVLLVQISLGCLGLSVIAGVVTALVASNTTPFAVSQGVSAGIGTLVIWWLYYRTGSRGLDASK